jgi:quercetin dioxygenase-like cupin family protein
VAAVTQPDVSRDVLFDVTIAKPRTVTHIEARRIRMGPGVAAGPHRHNGPVVGTIAEGSVIFQVDGGPETVLRPGDVFFEPEGVRIDRFDAQDDGVVFFAYFPLGDGQQSELSMIDTGE